MFSAGTDYPIMRTTVSHRQLDTLDLVYIDEDVEK